MAERFGLELHRENRQASGFALVVGKNGPKLEKFIPAATAPTLAESLTVEEVRERRKQQTDERMNAIQAANATANEERPAHARHLLVIVEGHDDNAVCQAAELDGRRTGGR